jgi:hypothetical protein
MLRFSPVADPDFNQKTKDDVLLANGYRCANPDCRMPIVLPKAGTISGTYKVGAVAHIRDARPHTPRYDDTLTPEQRAHISNALPLCLLCHGMVDSNPNMYPAKVLARWKHLSENFVNYSRPVLSMTPPLFLARGLVNRDLIGGHLLVGPVGLDGVCTDVRLELATMHGGVLSVFMDYDGEQGKAVLGKDWRRFLTREGLSGLHAFHSLVKPDFLDLVSDVLVCPFRVCCTFVHEGETIDFTGSWEALRLVMLNPKVGVFHALTLPWLSHFMGFLAAFPKWAGGGSYLYLFLNGFNAAWSTSATLDSLPSTPGIDILNLENTAYTGKLTLGADNKTPIALSIFNRETSTHLVIVTGDDPATLKAYLPENSNSYSWQKVTREGATEGQVANDLSFIANSVFETMPPLRF